MHPKSKPKSMIFRVPLGVNFLKDLNVNLPTFRWDVNISWGCLGDVLGALGACWERLGAQHGSNLALRTEAKCIQKQRQNQSFFEDLLESIFQKIFVTFG